MKAKRLHHRIRLNSDAQADIAWWQEFLPTWNGTAQFVDQQPTDAADLELYTDASGTHGCGAYFQGEWFHHDWQPHQQLSEHVSIQWQELFAIVAAALGATLGGRSASDSTVVTSRSSTRGKANLPSILVSCPCCARFFSQQLKITLLYSSKICLAK